MKYFVTIGLACFFPAYLIANPIESEDVVHATAHIGASYGITHVTEVVCHKVLKGHKTLCTVAGVATALTAGAIKEKMDGKGDNHTKGMLENLAGTGIAALVITIDY